MRNLTEVRRDGLSRDAGSIARVFACLEGEFGFAEVVAGEGHLFDASMNAGFLECFEGSGLGLRKARLDAPFGENPAATASLYQQELQTAAADAVADSGDLLARRRRLEWRRQSALC